MAVSETKNVHDVVHKIGFSPKWNILQKSLGSGLIKEPKQSTSNTLYNILFLSRAVQIQSNKSDLY